jgi:hypothetical protein
MRNLVRLTIVIALLAVVLLNSFSSVAMETCYTCAAAGGGGSECDPDGDDPQWTDCVEHPQGGCMPNGGWPCQ